MRRTSARSIGGGDPPPKDEGSESEKLQVANEAAVSREPRGVNWLIESMIKTFFENASFLIGGRVFLLGNTFLHRAAN
jgi:hypothetical protein